MARVVDANLNRARESLRVLDDFARFVRNDRVLTEALKELRHQVAAASDLLPAGLLLAGRDTPGDVGTTVGTSREYERSSPDHVAAVNAKRLQEALRSCEEYGKAINPAFAAAVEQARYRAYALEAPLLRDADRQAKLLDARLYWLASGEADAGQFEWRVKEALAGGVDAIQLRDKSLTDRELLRLADSLRRWTADAGALFIVNDRPDLAALADADGVHLGQDDLPVAAARRILGSDRLIGVSSHAPDDVRRAVLDGADYLGVGPLYPSRTKEFGTFPGLEFLRVAVDLTSLPLFGLGGVEVSRLPAILTAGGRRVAVSAAIGRSDDPRGGAATLRAALDLPQDG